MKEDQVNRNRTFDPANPTPVVETGWSYKGGVGSTCIDHSATSCPPEQQAQGQPRGMPTRGYSGSAPPSTAAAQAPAAPAAVSPAQSSGSAPAETEPQIYTFCYAQSGNTVFASDIFMSTARATSNLAMRFRQLLSDTYQRPLRSFSFGCDHSGLTSESQARDRKALTLKNMQSEGASLVDTGWRGLDMAPAQQGTIAPPAPGAPKPPSDPRFEQLPPKARELVLNEIRYSKQYCETNATLMAYDCDCFSRLILAARLEAGVHTEYAAGGRPVMGPQFSTLVMNTDYKSCPKAGGARAKP
jgi:hypothetical protein